MAHAVLPEGETSHIIAYRVIIHAECVATYTHTLLLVAGEILTRGLNDQRVIKGASDKTNEQSLRVKCVIFGDIEAGTATLKRFILDCSSPSYPSTEFASELR